MKKILGLSLGILGLFVLMVSSVLATNLILTPDLVNMAQTDSKIIEACLFKSGGDPLVGADLNVSKYCKDLNGNEVCDIGDTTFPTGFSAIATLTPTNSSGCGEITLTTISAPAGTYAYKVNGLDGGIVVASEHGLVIVPEFTTIGAALVLIASGFYARYKRRKK